MITLKTLIQNLETALNTELNAYENQVQKYMINDVPKNTQYAFALFSDIGEYEEATREQNTATVYFNGIARYIGQSLEGAAASAYNASMGATLDLLIPLSGRLTNTRKSNFVAEVRKLLDTAFQATSSTLIEDDGIIYLCGFRPEISRTGEREVNYVGDCVRFTVNLDYFFIAYGVSSDSVELTIDNERVYYSKIGFIRETVAENGIPSDSENGSSKTIPSGSVYTIHIDLPARTGALYEKYLDFLEDGTNEPMTVDIKQPKGFNSSYELEYKETSHEMIFQELSNSGETGRGVATSITLVEVI